MPKTKRISTSIKAKAKYPYYPYDTIKLKSQWHIIGHTSGKYWMQISSIGYRTKKEAIVAMKRQKMADRDAKRLVSEV